MSRRDTTPYAQMGAARTFAGVDVTEPKAGFYRTRLSGGSIRVGVRLHYGPPLDPVTGEVLDRHWRWQCDVNGEPYADFDRVWPACAAEPITEIEYQRFVTRKVWASEKAPASAYAKPGKRYDPLSLDEPMPF